MAKYSKNSRGQITGLLSPLLEKWRLDKIRGYIIGDCILDFGCGYGKLATKIPDMNYVGVDIDKNVLDSAKKMNNGLKKAKFYHLDMSEWRSYKFDTIILAAVIEHINDPNLILMDFKELLKPNGRMIITTPAPKANVILMLGSKCGLFSREALEDHKALLDRSYFTNIHSSNLILEVYEKFEFGLNQLIIYKK